MGNSLPSERAALLGVIDPDSYTAQTLTTAWADMSKHDTLLMLLMVGDMAATATIDAKLEQATDSSGTGAKDITGKAITQLVVATNPDDQVMINVRGDELDVDNAFAFVRASVTTAAAASDLSCALLGFDSRHGPTADNDLASVVEIVD